MVADPETDVFIHDGVCKAGGPHMSYHAYAVQYMADARKGQRASERRKTYRAMAAGTSRKVWVARSKGAQAPAAQPRPARSRGATSWPRRHQQGAARPGVCLRFKWLRGVHINTMLTYQQLPSANCLPSTILTAPSLGKEPSEALAPMTA